MAKAKATKPKKEKKAAKPKKGRASRKNKSVEEEVPQFNPYVHLDAQIDGMEKKFRLSAMAIDKDEPRFSTGLLTLNVMLAGGLLGGGWYTCFGGEQSCKSTTAMTILSAIMAQSDFVGKAAYFDYEGCVSEDVEIVTKEGPVKLRDILPSTIPPEGEAHPLPVDVESVDGMQESQFVYNKGIRPITKIVTSSDKTLRGFKHPVLTRRGDQLGWVLLEDLQLGDEVVVKRRDVV